MGNDVEPWATRVTAIVDVARGMAAAGPAPRGMPFFGIDDGSPTPLPLVAELATRGIFRKYEHVLDLGGGLGATTRYMAATLGCTATATASTPAEAAAGGVLTARAGLDWHVFHAAADATRLPFAEAAFTHVWVVDALPVLGPSDAVLAEAFRVLRPGGHLGIQDLVTRPGSTAPTLRGHVEATTRRREVELAGFVEAVCREVAYDAGGDAAGRAVRERLARRLGSDDGFVGRRRALGDALAQRRLDVVQVTARRP